MIMDPVCRVVYHRSGLRLTGPFQAAMTLNFSVWRKDWVWLPAG